MKETLHCRTAPSLTQWVTILVNQGWKIIDHEADLITAKRQLGQSEYPQKNTTVWYLTLEESTADPFSVLVTIDVPAFAESSFSQSRIYEEFDDIAAIVGNVELKENISIDLLAEVREQ